MLPEDVKQSTYDLEARKELSETIIAKTLIKNPAKIRKMAWDMIETSIQKSVKDTTEMFLHDEITNAEYEMMIHIISLALQKIKTMHT